MLVPPTLALAIWLGWPQMPPTLADLEFVMAVEESVIGRTGHDLPSPTRA